LQALAIREKLAPKGLDAAETLNSIGDVALANNDLARSKSYYERALTIRESLAPRSADLAESLAALATIARRESQLDKAKSYYQQALEALENQTAHLGGSTDARAGFRAKHENWYRGFIDLLVSQHQSELAFDVLERSRARSLLEILAAGHIDIHKGADPALLDKERDLQADLRAKSERRAALLAGEHNDEQIRRVGNEISDLISEYQDVEAQIRSASPIYAALAQPTPVTLAYVQHDLLDRDTVLLEYSLGEERSYVFAVTQDSIHVYTLPKHTEIERIAKRLYSLITARNRRTKGEGEQSREMRIARADQEYGPVAAALGNILLMPVAAQLNHKRLLIVAEGVLLYVPFAALPSPQVRGSQTPDPLIASHEIVNLPSASILSVLRREAAARRPPSQEVAILADPVFDRADRRVQHIEQNKVVQDGLSPANDAAALESDGSIDSLTRSAVDLGLIREGQLHLARLPFTRREAEDIWSVVPPDRSRKALDFEASRDMALGGDLARYRIVHFATHALVDEQHPELSGLVLSLVDRKGAPQDGFVDLQDIYNLNLGADLVVLSACETALGKQVDGEGMIGLSRGFMYAGASRVVGSLWNVTDFVTAQLMTRFYRSMEQERTTPAQALRRAQLDLLRQKHWSAPYYWAGFALQGEWK
jgi:CHAT domain-containing protein